MIKFIKHKKKLSINLYKNLNNYLIFLKTN